MMPEDMSAIIADMSNLMQLTESLGVSESVSASVEKKDGSYEKGLFP